MTTQADFTPEEWEMLKKTLHEPGAAVMLAAPGGMLRELLAIAKGLAEAAEAFADSEFVQSLLRDSGTTHPKTSGQAAPEREKVRDEYMNVVIHNLRQAVKIAQTQASAKELEDYRRLVLFLAEKIAGAAREGSASESVTEAEKRVLDEIKLALYRRA